MNRTRRITPLSKRPGRAITVAGLRWKWRAGRSSIVAYSESDHRLWATLNHAFGRDYAQGDPLPVTPGQVALWIRASMAERNWHQTT